MKYVFLTIEGLFDDICENAPTLYVNSALPYFCQSQG